jgi:hypothetical protein
VGELDQFIKKTFEDETPLATQQSARFEVPKETPTTEVHADGLLYLLNEAKVRSLPLPWCLMKSSPLVFEFKMQGDKLDLYHYERALLRRQAAQVDYLKKNPNDPDPPQLPLWIVTGYLREWMEEKHVLIQLARGCYRLEPSSSRVYLVAANELPLREELIPFLVTRTGQKLVDFCKWFLTVRPERCEELVEIAPMSEANYEEILAELKAPELAERLRRRRRFAETIAEVTGLQDELLQAGEQKGEQKGQHKTLQHQFEKRLARSLTKEELDELGEKMLRLGAERVSDVVLELPKDALSSWLQDSRAV